MSIQTHIRGNLIHSLAKHGTITLEEKNQDDNQICKTLVGLKIIIGANSLIFQGL